MFDSTGISQGKKNLIGGSESIAIDRLNWERIECKFCLKNQIQV